MQTSMMTSGSSLLLRVSACIASLYRDRNRMGAR